MGGPWAQPTWPAKQLVVAILASCAVASHANLFPLLSILIRLSEAAPLTDQNEKRTRLKNRNSNPNQKNSQSSRSLGVLTTTILETNPISLLSCVTTCDCNECVLYCNAFRLRWATHERFERDRKDTILSLLSEI